MTQTALLHAAEAIATALQMTPGDEQRAAIVAAAIHLDEVRANQYRAELSDLRAALRAHTEHHTHALEPIHDRLHQVGNHLNELLARLNEQADHADQLETQVIRVLREMADIRQWHALAVPTPPLRGEW